MNKEQKKTQKALKKRRSHEKRIKRYHNSMVIQRKKDLKDFIDSYTPAPVITKL